tara:strand:- start:1386 stop:1757 length:372 start_codon:yes stop_codon:yes gene_type:complete
MKNNSNSAVTLAHLRLPVGDLSKAIEFFESLGGRQDVDRHGFAVVELVDNTRVQLTQTSETKLMDKYLQFDFKVDDIDVAWDECQSKGMGPSDITRKRPGHDFFLLSGPDGCEVKINSKFLPS